MFKQTIIVATLTGLAALGSIHSCPAVPAPAVSANAPKTLTALNGMIWPGDAVYEMGSISSQPSAALTHTFVLRNDTRTALTLDHLQSSCPCTSATIAGGTGAGIALAPGQSLSVSVAVNSQMLSPGLLHKSVWVFVQGQDAPAATLEMTGALLPHVALSPTALNFGRLEKQAQLTLLLTVTPQETRLEQGTELHLVSADPDVQITDVPASAAMPGVLSYRVRLAPRNHTGRLQGKLSLVLTRTGDPAGTLGPVVSTVSWLGEVAGSVTATPSFAAFGTPAHGQPATKRVILSGKGLGSAWKTLSTSSANPNISATLKPITGKTDQVEMTVRLAPNTATGPLDTRLIITEQNGEQIVLPVFAVVK